MARMTAGPHERLNISQVLGKAIMTELDRLQLDRHDASHIRPVLGFLVFAKLIWSVSVFSFNCPLWY